MLQQTRVDYVRTYYERFLDTFPTLEDLAEADINEILRIWEGLGYYARARNLHTAVQQVVASGRTPVNSKELRSLP
ncbi:MAG: A/G-specific adenine glycosylase, partial [Bacteroidetes bacterium]|nr:A/G-specific adenine glycosylase [Bacteroidota bacterium]